MAVLLRDTNLDVSPWVKVSVPVKFTDDWGTTGMDFDGNDDIIHRPEIFTAVTVPSNRYTVSGWFETTSSGVLIAQTANTGLDLGCFHISIGGSGTMLARCMDTSSTNAILSESSGTFADGVLRWFGMTTPAFDVLKLYIDGQEISYGTQDQKFGTGAPNLENNGVALSIGAFEEGSTGQSFLGCKVTRPVLQNEALSAAGMLAEYNNEIAALTPGRGTIFNQRIFPQEVTNRVVTRSLYNK